MANEQPISNTSYSFFTRALVAFPFFGYFIATYLCVQEYGAHKQIMWSFPYTAMYYGQQPTQTLIYSYIIFIAGFILPFAWLFGKNDIKDKYGSAKLATTAIIKKMNLFNDNGVILGVWKTGTKTKLLKYTRPLSSLILAPAGTGKTVSVSIPNILGLNELSLVIHDPKGELCAFTGNYRKTFSKVLIYNFSQKDCSVFNPFCKTVLPKEIGDYQAYVENIATIIFPDQKGGDTYWVGAARNLFTLMALNNLFFDGETNLNEIYITSKKESTSNKVFRSILTRLQNDKPEEKGDDFVFNDEDGEIEVDEEEEERNILREKIIVMANAMLQISSSSNQMAGVTGGFDNGMKIFTETKITKATSGVNQLPFTEMREELYTVYLIVEEKDRERLRPIITLLLEIMVKELISVLPVEDDNRITFILDEFTRLKGIQTVKTLPEICRGYNMSVIYIAQDYEQVEIVFGKEMTGILQTLCAYKVIFKQNNHKTAKMICDLVGDYTDTKTTTNFREGEENKKQYSEQETGTQLITPQDVLNLETGQVFITVEGFAKNPIKTESAYYENTPEFKKLVKKYEAKTFNEVMENL